MKKVIRLTENDLARIVRRIVNESTSRYKLPEGITMELINRFLEENDPNVLKRISYEDPNVNKKLIRSFYVDQKSLKEIVNDFRQEAENGTLYDEEWQNERFLNLNNPEQKILKLKKWVLDGLSRWSKVPSVEDSKKFLKKYEASQLKQSLYNLLSSYRSKLSSDEINDILVHVMMNKSSGPETFEVDPEWVKRNYGENPM